MGFYDTKILPFLIDKACGVGTIEAQREIVVPQAQGEVLEIGFSSMSERLIEGKGAFELLHPEGENSHMNHSYGTLWLAQYFAHIKAQPKR